MLFNYVPMSSKIAVRDHSFEENCIGREVYISFCRTYIKVPITSVLNSLHNDVSGGERWLEIEVSTHSVYVERIVYNRSLINKEFKMQL